MGISVNLLILKSENILKKSVKRMVHVSIVNLKSIDVTKRMINGYAILLIMGL